jgi:nucleotide-binding universal stress UspA family protein
LAARAIGGRIEGVGVRAEEAVVDRVVVVVDGTAAGEAAVDWVLARARLRQPSDPFATEVTAVYDPLPSESVLAGEDFRTAYGDALEAAARRITDTVPHADVTRVLRTGQPRSELVRAARDADLVVVGTSRRGTVADSIYGSLPIRLAAAAPCPVVVVPAAWSRGSGVMVGLEGTGQQPPVVDFAAREAEAAGEELTVVHTWNVPTLIAVAAFAHPRVWGGMLDLHARALAATMAHVRSSWPDLTVHERLKEGIAARILTEDAAESSLLVVGRSDHGAVGDALLGSTSHDLLLTMPCPVAVVPWRGGAQSPQ